MKTTHSRLKQRSQPGGSPTSRKPERWTIARCAIGAIALAAFGCGGATLGATSAVLEPSVIGAQPAPRLKDGGMSAPTFSLFVASRGPNGRAPPNAEDFDVQCSAGPCAIVRARWVPGSEQGVLAVVVDDSGSNTASPSACTGCPTDPEGKRKVAVKHLVRGLLERAPGWRVGLFDFGPGPTSHNFVSTRMIAGYTSRIEDLEAGAELLKSSGGTFLYDALYAVPRTAVGEQRFSFPDGGAPVRLLVVSDGEDTHSTFSLGEALDAGVSLGVRFDAVGYGQVDGGTTPWLARRAYEDLRSCSAATGGLITLVSRDTLPALFAQLAEIYVEGYAELVVQLPTGATAMSGSVGLKGSSTRAPFSYQ